MVTAVLAAAAAICAAVSVYRTSSGGNGDALPEFGNRKETIRLWYTDDALTDYLNSKTLEFLRAHGYPGGCETGVGA